MIECKKIEKYHFRSSIVVDIVIWFVLDLDQRNKCHRRIIACEKAIDGFWLIAGPFRLILDGISPLLLVSEWSYRSVIVLSGPIKQTITSTIMIMIIINIHYIVLNPLISSVPISLQNNPF